MNRMPENCCTTASTKHERSGERAGHGRRIGLGLLMVLPSLPGGLIVLRALTLPRNSPGLPDLCPLHRTTGLWCPLCGGTRATRELMHGDLGAAMGLQPLCARPGGGGHCAGGALVARIGPRPATAARHRWGGHPSRSGAGRIRGRAQPARHVGLSRPSARSSGLSCTRRA